jgi:hypothetical protein
MRFWQNVSRAVFATFLLVFMLSCGSPGPPQPPSLELPKVVTDLRAARKGDKVSLVWTVPTETTDLQTVRHLGPTLICRNLQVAMNRCGIPAGQVSPHQTAGQHEVPVQSTYVDTLPSDLQQKYPTRMISYAVEVQNVDHRSAGLSNQVRIPVAPTWAAPADLRANVTADGVALTWTSAPDEHPSPELRHIYRVYRREAGTNKDALAGEISLNASPEQNFTDHSFEWQKTYQYRVAAVTVIAAPNAAPIPVEGDDSAPVEVVAKDVFPPAVPSGLQAVASGVGQRPFIDLTWAPVIDADLAGYNVYRHVEGAAPVKINTELVKSPAFRDNSTPPGTKYIYSVSAVDLRGNESERSEEASETVPTS